MPAELTAPTLAIYTQGPFTALNATSESQQIVGVLRYEVTPAISIYGGLRYMRSKAEIYIPAALVGTPVWRTGRPKIPAISLVRPVRSQRSRYGQH